MKKKKAAGFLKELVGAFKKGYGAPKKKAVKRKAAKPKVAAKKSAAKR